jgi:hypothetical protein
MTKVTATQALESRKDIDSFARKYGAYIGDSRQYRRRVPEPMMWDDPRAVYQHTFLTHTYDEPYVEIHIPRGSFEHILARDEVQEQDAFKVKHALDVLKQHRVDEQVRNDNPAVQKAWRNYLMLLELARK